VIGVARIHYEIDDDLHRRAKAAAALQGVTLKAFIEAALERAVSEAGGSAQRNS
jgi:predicted HicB family RNase H-like nuclease